MLQMNKTMRSSALLTNLLSIFLILPLPIAGQMIWKQEFHERSLRNLSQFNQLLTLGDNRYIVAGVTETEFRSASCFIACYDSSATLQWAIRDSSVYGDLPGGKVITAYHSSSETIFSVGFGYAVQSDSMSTTYQPRLSAISTDGHVIFKKDIAVASAQPYDVKLYDNHLYILMLVNQAFGLQTSICKYDLSGNLIWCKSYDQIASDEYPVELIITPGTGRLYAAYQSEIAIKLMEFSSIDGTVLHLSDPIQSTQTASVFPANFVTDQQGNIYLGCSLKFSGINSYDYVLVKYTPDTDIAWQKIIPQPYDQQLSRIAIHNNSLYFTGVNSESVIRTCQLNTNGDIIWQKGYSSVNYPVTVYDLIPGNDKSLYIIGWEHLNLARRDVFLIRYDSLGSVLASHQIKGIADEDVVLPRFTWSPDQTKLYAAGLRRRFVTPEMAFYPFWEELIFYRFDRITCQPQAAQSTQGIGIGVVSSRWVKYDGQDAVYQAGHRNRGFYVTGNVNFFPTLDFYLARYDTSGALVWRIFLDSLNESLLELQPPVDAELDQDGNPLIVIQDVTDFALGINQTLLFKFSKEGHIEWKSRLNGPHTYTYPFAFRQHGYDSYMILRRDTVLDIIKINTAGEIIAEHRLANNFIGCSNINTGNIEVLPDQQVLAAFQKFNCSEGFSIARLTSQLEPVWQYNLSNLTGFKAYPDKNMVIIMDGQKLIRLRLDNGVKLQDQLITTGIYGVDNLLFLDDRIVTLLTDSIRHYSPDNFSLIYQAYCPNSNFHSNTKWALFGMDGSFYGRIFDIFGQPIGQWNCAACSNTPLTPLFNSQVNFYLGSQHAEGWDISDRSIYLGAVGSYTPLQTYGSSFAQLMRYDYRKDLPLTPEYSIHTQTSKLLVYPNPAVERVTVRFSENQATRVKINVYNTGAQLIKTDYVEAYAGENYLQIDTSVWPEGLYFLQIETKNNIKHAVIAVERRR